MSIPFSGRAVSNIPCGRICRIEDGKVRVYRCIARGDQAEMRLSVPTSIGTTAARIFFWRENGERICETNAEWQGSFRGEDRYCFRIPREVSESIGLYFYGIMIDSFLGNVSAGTTDEADGVAFWKGDAREFHPFQLTVYEFINPPPPKALAGGIVYHIFVDRFKSTGKYLNARNDVVLLDWDKDEPEYPQYNGGHLQNNTFFGGDLDGITEKLDYIASLGANCLYLSPIFESYSNHKYDTGDYMKVDSMFGGDEALSRLIAAAKKKGIVIVLDGVFNHTGSDSLYFNKYSKYKTEGAFNSVDSKYFKWYNFQNYPNEYECWWGIDTLPRLNLGYLPCKEYFVGKDGVIDKYMSMGISGFRLDVADELPDEFIESLKAASCRRRRRSVVWGEVWEDASNKTAYGQRKHYFWGRELDGVMNYPLRRGIIDFFTHNDCGVLKYAINSVGLNCPKRIADHQLNFLGTHDTERIITALSGDDEINLSTEEKSRFRMPREKYALAQKRLRSAYLTLIFMPGIPSIFYGDEAGIEGYGDPYCRRVYPWGKQDRSLLEYYSQAGKLRRGEPLFSDGESKLYRLTDDQLIFGRENDTSAILLVVNNSKSSIKIEAEEATELFNTNEGRVKRPHIREVFELPPGEGTVLKIQKDQEKKKALTVS